MIEYKYNKRENKFTEDGHIMFEEDVLQRLKRLAYLEEQIKQWQTLPMDSVSGSYLPKCSRMEVIDRSGRAYTNYDCKSVETQMQDDDRTLKVFIS